MDLEWIQIIGLGRYIPIFEKNKTNSYLKCMLSLFEFFEKNV